MYDINNIFKTDYRTFDRRTAWRVCEGIGVDDYYYYVVSPGVPVADPIVAECPVKEAAYAALRLLTS